MGRPKQPHGAAVALALVIVLMLAGVAETPEHRHQGARPAMALPSRGAQPEPAPRVMVFEATGYSHNCGNGDGVTATGTVPRPGVISVDPAVIPLGMELWIEGYGPGRAEDTGGAIKGHRVDLFFETEAEAWEWGRRRVEVLVKQLNGGEGGSHK